MSNGTKYDDLTAKEKDALSKVDLQFWSKIYRYDQFCNKEITGWSTKFLPYLRKEHDLRFVAGFVGIKQDKETKALRPEINWMVTRRKSKIPNN